MKGTPWNAGSVGCVYCHSKDKYPFSVLQIRTENAYDQNSLYQVIIRIYQLQYFFIGAFLYKSKLKNT